MTKHLQLGAVAARQLTAECCHFWKTSSDSSSLNLHRKPLPEGGQRDENSEEVAVALGGSGLRQFWGLVFRRFRGSAGSSISS